MRPTTTSAALLLLTMVAAALSSTTHAASASASSPPRLAPGNVTAAGCSPRERDALLAFKRGITADPAGLLASWRHQQAADCCRWRGVRCRRVRAGRQVVVVGLHLRNVHAYQQQMIDYQETALAGEMSQSLQNLRHLEHLDLSLNALQGPSSRVPKFLGSLKSLRYLNLSGIPFSGEVPPQLGNLTNLHYLDLSARWSNVFSGYPTDMTSSDLSWLKRMRSLTYLDMYSTNLSRVHDWAHVVNSIPSLKVLRLASCELAYSNQSFSRFNLTNLQELDLSSNYFDHPIASCWFWDAKGLCYLNIASTKLYGQFLNTTLGHLKSIQILDLSSSSNVDVKTANLGQLESIQILDLSFTSNMGIMNANMTNLCNLRILDLQQSQLHGDIAEFIQRLPHCLSSRLNELYLSNNNLTGMLPNHLDHLTSLVILDISLNKLSGTLPSKIGMFSNLSFLDLSSNNLHGVITDEHFASLRSLKTLWLSGNSMRILVDSEWLPPFSLEDVALASCHIGPSFPSWLKWQVNITYLDISSANITDKLPDWFSTTFSNIGRLDISNNAINGSLPANMEVMTSLSRLYLNSNKLSGQIPVLPEGLNIMDISRNSLSGPLPSNFGALYLSDLRLFSNRITGHIPQSMCELQSLDILDLADNLLVGEFPQCFHQIELTMLLASNNMLSGKFPPFLQSSQTLYILDLAFNNFHGRLPMWIGELSKLEILRLGHNNFSGSVPTTITNITKLLHLDLSSNSISGVLPFHLSNLTGMTSLSSPTTFGHYVPILNMSVDTKSHEHYYQEGVIFQMVTIDLSLNYLTGGIPEEIASLDGIKNLNLSWNQFSGRIPENIGAKRSLESLDLSENNLFGEIPSSILNLTYLSSLDLSYNHLTGRIPSGGQLDTLYAENPSMYNGNNGLCGCPLQRNCSDDGNNGLCGCPLRRNCSDDGNNGNNSSPSKHGVEKRSEKYSDTMFLYFGLGSGFVAGLWVVFCTILFMKAWRIAYSRLFDKVFDKVYVFVVVTWAHLCQKSGTR